MITRRTTLGSLLTLLLPQAARAHSYTVGNIAIGHVWGLPSQSRETQVFAPMNNRGKDKDELVAARSTVCSMIELRRNNRYEDPVLQSIELLPGKPIAMRPSARHLRLIGLTRELRPGDRFDLILDFLNAGETQVEVMVEGKEGH